MLPTVVSPQSRPSWAGPEARAGLIGALKGFWARRKAPGRLLLTLIVLNEIRGLVVVIAVVACWRGGH
jgi:hypothetical protein